MDIFKEVKSRVTAKMAAEHYGLRVYHNGMAHCPFHDDKHPSMKVDETYYCFACGVSGDAIDYVAKMFGLSQYNAALKLNQDFSLGIEIAFSSKKKKGRSNKKPKEKSKQERANLIQKKLDEWLTYATNVLIRYLKWIEFWKDFYKPKSMDEEWHPLFVEALDNESKINCYLDILMFGDGQKILDFFEFKRGDIKAYEQRVEEYERGVVAEIREYCHGGDDDSFGCEGVC